MEKNPYFLVGKLSSQFNPCLNTCLEASWCTVFPQQAAAAASACSLHDTAVGPGLVTQAPAAPEVKQQLCSLWGKRLASLERMTAPAFPTAQTQCLWYCESARAQLLVPPCPCSGSPPPWPLGKEQPCSCLLLAGNRAPLAENGSVSAQKITAVNELPEIIILEHVLAVLYSRISV